MDSSIKKLLLLTNKEFERMSIEERKEYFKSLRDYCKKIQHNRTNITLTQRLVNRFGPLLRNYQYKIVGEENIPYDGCLLMCNHSNTHDAFTTLEFLTEIGLPSTFLAGEEGLSPLEIGLFKSARATLINRSDRESTTKGLCDFASKLISGDTGVIFGEGTWNLHPFKPMLNIKLGGVKIASIASKPIIPVIYEYVEIPDLCSKENELYSMCIIKVGKPFMPNINKNLIEQTDELQKVMENMRINLWKELGIYREKIEDINTDIYLNHTWLKKFGTPLFEFDSERENGFLFIKNGEQQENEYTMDDSGNLVPGVLIKSKTIKGIKE